MHKQTALQHPNINALQATHTPPSQIPKLIISHCSAHTHTHTLAHCSMQRSSSRGINTSTRSVVGFSHTTSHAELHFMSFTPRCVAGSPPAPSVLPHIHRVCLRSCGVWIELKGVWGWLGTFMFLERCLFFSAEKQYLCSTHKQTLLKSVLQNRFSNKYFRS